MFPLVLMITDDEDSLKVPLKMSCQPSNICFVCFGLASILSSFNYFPFSSLFLFYKYSLKIVTANTYSTYWIEGTQQSILLTHLVIISYSAKITSALIELFYTQENRRKKVRNKKQSMTACNH